MRGERSGSIVLVSGLRALNQKIMHYAQISTLVFALSILFTFLGSNRLVRVATNPILHLARVAERVSVEKDYTLRASAAGNDEIGILVRSFNDMLDGIRLRDDALQRANDELEVHVQARTEALQREIGERVEAQEALSKERQILRALIDNVPDFMYVKDTQSRFLLANQTLARSVGLSSPDELLGKTDFRYHPLDMAEGFYQDEQEIIRTGQPMFNQEEEGIIGPDGSRVCLLNYQGAAFRQLWHSNRHRRYWPRHHSTRRSRLCRPLLHSNLLFAKFNPAVRFTRFYSLV